VSRASRAPFALGVLLAAFGALLGCGQRGPLTLPTSARPIENKAPPAGAAQGSAAAPAGSAQGSVTAPADAAPRPEDEERRKSE
jgi:predicted small lipoprotein YifL